MENINEIDEYEVLEASHVYLLMKKEYRISRNIRAQWYLKHLNKTVETKQRFTLDEFTEEIEVISAVPKFQKENVKNVRFLVSPSTRVTFLSRCYRLVFCLDLSPSTASVDIQNGSILFDEVFTALKQSLIGVAKPFQIPGSSFIFEPEIYVTIIAHMPFYALDGEQVLVQSWRLTSENVALLLEQACNKLQVGSKIVKVTSTVNKQREKIRAQAEKLTGALFDEVTEVGPHSNYMSNVSMTTPDINTINMLRYGILALQLLPENSSAGIVVITDGMLTLPNTVMLESLLIQLRNNTIASSFLHLGSTYHPLCCLGLLPYPDLMKFIAKATLGAYISCINQKNTTGNSMNIYHESFLTWKFQGSCMVESIENTDLNFWGSQNPYFSPKFDQPVMRKRQFEGNLPVSLSSVLSCRLREGYTVKHVKVKGETIEITLSLPWKFNVSIEYTLSASSIVMDETESSKSPSCHFEVIIEGTYDFLHDVTCTLKPPSKSPYRAAVIKQFWSTMKNLEDTDHLLAHLQSFGHNPINYTIPDSIKNGLPLFYLTPASLPDLSAKNLSHSQFAAFWRPICLLDINLWQRWMHTHRIGIILEHDMPLPRNVHLPNASGRYSIIQCRQALISLNALLKDYSSFVLIDNHSYIKFLAFEPDRPPYSFYIIRVTSKAPCMVIRLAFLGGMPGHQRHQIVDDLRSQIMNLKFPRRGLSKDCQVRLSNDVTSSFNHTSKSPLRRDWLDVQCCVLLQKPVEKILIKYERIPDDFLVPISLQSSSGADPLASSMLTTLSRYLFSHRWIWSVQSGTNSQLPVAALAGVLNTIVKLRLQEGFHFAHSHSGIINLILELDFKDPNDSSNQKSYPCVVQYIVFPPHANRVLSRDSISEGGEDELELETTEADGELQLVTESWIEPLNGVADSKYFQGFNYQQVAKGFFSQDFNCVSCLTTFHHLSLMCLSSKIPSPHHHSSPLSKDNTPLITDPPINSMYPPDFSLSQGSLHSQAQLETHLTTVGFPFDLNNVLPLCQQTELIFSTLIQDLTLQEDNHFTDFNDCSPNDILFSLLFDTLSSAHDRELTLSDRDHITFPRQVLSRDRPAKVYRAPFTMDDTSFSFEVFKEGLPECPSSPYKFKGLVSSPSSGKTGLNPNAGTERTSQDGIPKWRCFIKNLSASHLLLTLLPASYHDLKLLVLGNISGQEIFSSISNLPNKALRIVKRLHDDGVENAHLADESHQTSACEGYTDNQAMLNSSIDFKLKKNVRVHQFIEEMAEEDIVETVNNELSTHMTVPSKFPDTETNDPISNQVGPESSIQSFEHLKDFYHKQRVYGSLTLPIYNYHCSLPNIISKLVYQDENQNSHDIYQDLTYKASDDSCKFSGKSEVLEKAPKESVNACFLGSESIKSPNKQASPEAKSDESEIKTFGLKKMASQMENIFSRSFVNAVFKSLQLHLHIDGLDIESVVDGICSESVLEIDIGKFMKVICGHLKGHNCSEFPQQKSLAENQTSFPAASFLTPCYHLKTLHSSIKEQFSDTIQQYFQPIPTKADFAFFSPKGDVEYNLSDAGDEGNENFCYHMQDDDEDYNFSSSNNRDDIEFASEIGAKDTSQSSTKEQEKHFSCVSHSTHPEEYHNPGLEYQYDSSIVAGSNIGPSPLFVHLTCTLKTKNYLGSCSLNSLPTCLSEIINSLEEPIPNLDLNNFGITLDVLCLTFPMDSEPIALGDGLGDNRTLSCCSATSPLPEAESTMFSEHSSDYLKELPDFQFQAVNKCIEKVKWLLEDEISSAALNSSQVTLETLEMVANHIEASDDSAAFCCIKRDVPLRFVFGPERSLEKFMETFKEMTFSTYHLEKEDRFYYLVLDEERHDPEANQMRSTPLAMDLQVLNMFNEIPGKDDQIAKPSNQDTGTTNDEADLEDVESRRRGRYRSNRRSSLRSTQEPNFSPVSPPTFVLPNMSLNIAPPTLTERNLKDNVILVKPLPSLPITDTIFDQSSESESKNAGSQISSFKKNLSESSEYRSVSESSSVTVVPIMPNESSFDDNPHLTGSSEFTSSVDERSTVTFRSGNFKAFPSKGVMKPLPSRTISHLLEESDEIKPRERADSLELPANRNEIVVSPGRKMFLQGKTESASSTPFFYSDCDGASFPGNTEDGYEGDSSDCASEWEPSNPSNLKQSILPKFWLFMEILADKVAVYFHIRHCKIEDNDMKTAKEVFRKTIRWVKNLCRVVNQSMLLQELHATHMCHQLLVPEASEDIWKNEDNSSNIHPQNNNRLHSFEDSEEPFEHLSGLGYLEAEMRFKPGAFDCNVVWQTHFYFHPRLSSGLGRGSISRGGGVQALRTVLASFSVTNRKNMFVYQERGGNVFYLRLHETTCSGHPIVNQVRAEDESPLSGDLGSRSSSVHSLHQKKADTEDDFLPAEFRPRLSSAVSDKDQSHDSISITSRISSTRRSQQCIALHVHGIGEAGSEVKEELVQVLQSRLDEAVLEVITTMLSRNPKSKLTPEDVQFIQKPGKEAGLVLQLTIHSLALNYLSQLVHYLRQNLLNFLHNPNYMEKIDKMENHFQAFNEDASVPFCDEDAFLYSRQQASGTSGSKGIACIILSLVDGHGRLVNQGHCTMPSPTTSMENLILEHQYEELTQTKIFIENKNQKTPGPIALIRFQIWCVGKVDTDQLTIKLISAVRHALWDLLMEFRIMCWPIAEPREIETKSSISEPSTPIKCRRSGRMIGQNTKELQPVKSPLASPTESISFFKFATALEASSILASSVSTGRLIQNATPTPGLSFIEAKTLGYESGEKGRLSYLFQTTFKSFMEFGHQLGVPTVHKQNFTFTSRHQVPFFLQELQTQLNELNQEIFPKVFLGVGEEFLPYNIQSNRFSFNLQPDPVPGQACNFVVVGRNINLWRTFLGCADISSALEGNQIKHQTSGQKYIPLLHELFSSSSSLARTANATPTSCLGSPLSTGPLSSLSPFPSPCFNIYGDPKDIPFVPRQRLLVLFLNDLSLSLYAYNWSTESCNNVCKLVSQLVDWHNHRSMALTNLINQKLGLFHDQPLSKNKKLMELQQTAKSSAPLQYSVLWDLDYLLLNQSPPVQIVKKSASVVPAGPSWRSHSFSSEVSLRDLRPPKPMHCSEYSGERDPALKFGHQLKDIRQGERRSPNRSMEELHHIWTSQDASLTIPFMDKLMQSMRGVSRLSHFCMTPILFSPTWRWKVAPIRDHALEHGQIFPSNTFSQVGSIEVKSQPRSRNVSGTSLPRTDSSSQLLASSIHNRIRNTTSSIQSAANIPSVVSSPKPRKSQPDEAWHFAICTNYIQEYIEYLQTLGFVAIQTKSQYQRQSKSGRGSTKDAGDAKKHASSIFSTFKNDTSSNQSGLPVYLIKNLLGGLLFFEVGFNGPYAYGHLYSLECKRMQTDSHRTLRSQFTMAFLDDLDKIKNLMHLHSFTYDFHLRTIHSYISGRLLLFRQGYHITSFLDDFIKYYQKSPNFSRNLIRSGKLVIPNIRMPGSQLYNYIISHNELYGMRVIRMVPLFQGTETDTEFALVELSTYKASHKDANDINHVDSFDVGLLVSLDNDSVHTSNGQPQSSNHVLVLKFYILLTSQRELYPKLMFESKLGSFLPVRFGANKTSSLAGSTAGSQPNSTVPSRKTSAVNVPISAELQYNKDIADNIGISNFAVPLLSMCDEEVSYLGYFSSHETLMLKILNERAESTSFRLEAIVGRAAVHCCRDFLWSCLLPRGRSSNSKEVVMAPMTYEEFTEMLALVTSIPLNDLDPELAHFLNMHPGWYISLAKLLQNKFPLTSRSFLAPDGSIQHVVVTDLKCPDSFMRLTVNYVTNKSELCIVFRKPLLDQEHSPDKPNFRVLALESLVEDFVNNCCFHLWTCLL